MKTAISIPTPIFHAAEQLAQRNGVSRSELYTRAIATYLKAHQGDGVTQRLDAVYAMEESSTPVPVDPVIHALQLRSLPQEEW